MTPAALLLSLACMLLGQSQPALKAEKEPHPNRGVYAIWYQGDREFVLDMPFIKGGQVYCQWGEVEATEGQYDWSKLDGQLKMLHEKGLKATVQINGNVKPDWMFKKIPYWPGKLPQVQNRQGAPMYWHPDFIAAYKRFLAAQAEYVRNSPYRDAVLGMRMNFSAIGNEYLNAKATGTDLSKWVVPEGASREGMRVWDETIPPEYEKMVTEEYIKLFLPDIYVFVRAHMDQEAREPFMEYFENGRMGWFHTGAQPIEPKISWWQNLYQTFTDYNKTGKTLAYAEPVSDSFGFHGNKTGTLKPQAPWINYWRTLVDLQYGTDFIAYYGNDLRVAHDGKHYGGYVPHLKAGHLATIEFAAKYAGYLNSPSQSPGAWVAMRQLNRKPGEEKLLMTDDCNFLMRRLPDNSKGVEKIGAVEERYGGWARVMPAGEMLKFDIDDNFAHSIHGAPSKVHVVYFDDKQSQMTLNAFGESFDIQMKNSGKWEKATLDLKQSDTAKATAEADITLLCKDQDVIVHMVELTRD